MHHTFLLHIKNKQLGKHILGMLILICCYSLSASAQNASVKGRAVGSYSKAPIADITVVLKGTDYKTRTDSTGYYSFAGILPKKYTLVFIKMIFSILNAI